MIQMTQATDTPNPAAKTPIAAPISGALALLTIIYTLNFVDRQIINILGEAIKKDLHLLDGDLGLLSGLSFALLYTIFGFPIAAKAETGNRPSIIATCVVIWSGFTALCGLAQNFWQLALARLGVGLGEAGCTPPAHSLIADLVPPEKRGRAMAIYALGVPIGSALGFLIGAFVAVHFGWRAAFWVVGLPGVILGAIAWRFLPEPRQLSLNGTILGAAPINTRVGLAAAVPVLLKSPVYIWVVVAATLISLLGYGQAIFVPGFLSRVHHMGLMDKGVALALISLIGGGGGTFLGGAIADHWGKKNSCAYVVVPAIGFGLSLPFLYVALTAQSLSIVLVSFGIQIGLNAFWFGPLYALIQNQVENHMRATAVALMLFILNLIGLGLGPWLMGALSDFGAAQTYGPDFVTQCTGKVAPIAATIASQCEDASAHGLSYALLASTILAIPIFISLFAAYRALARQKNRPAQ